MKSLKHTSFPRPRILMVSAVAALIGTATAVAQQSGSSGASGSSGSSSTGSSTDRPSGSYNAGSSTSGSGSGSAGSSYGSPNSSSSGGSSYDSSTTSSGSGSSAMSSSSSSGRLGWMDRRFVSKAADSGMEEVQLATLASQRATNTEVRSFAEKLLQDHQQVNSELKQIASSRNVKLDDDEGKDRAYKRLSKQSGSEFDREFVEHMIDEHEKDIKLFEKASTEARDQEVRSFASKNLAHLREHLQTAQSLRQSLMPTGREDDSSGRSSSGSSSSSSSPGSSSSSSAAPAGSSSSYPGASSSSSPDSSSSSSPSSSSSSSPGSSSSSSYPGSSSSSQGSGSSSSPGSNSSSGSRSATP